MTRALALLVVLALPSTAFAQLGDRDQTRQRLEALRHNPHHETIAFGAQLRLGHGLGDAFGAETPGIFSPFGVGRQTAAIGGGIEAAGLVDFRFSERSHWHMRVLVYVGLSTDRTNFGNYLHPWRVGARWFPLAVGFGSDLITLRVGADLALTWGERWGSDSGSPFMPMMTPTPIYFGDGPLAHIAPNVELGFEVTQGWEVNLYGMWVFIAGDAGSLPLMYGEYGLSVAALFW